MYAFMNINEKMATKTMNVVWPDLLYRKCGSGCVNIPGMEACFSLFVLYAVLWCVRLYCLLSLAT